MNEKNGSLSFVARLDTSRLISDAEASKRALKSIGETGEKEGNRLQQAFNKTYNYLGVGALAGAASIGMLGKAILDTTAKFEKFGIVLRNTLGDARGTEALAMIANFAATTPFQLDEVTGAFIKMANQGFVPTREEMVKLGDLASSTGKSFDMLAEAILDAQTGEFERLKEFGIKASQNGDKVTFSFKEQQTTVDKTNSSIRAYILSLGDLNGIAGANAKISESLTGQMSNLGDKIAAMYNEIGTANKGILYGAVGTAATLVENYEAIGEALTVLISIYGIHKVATMAWVYHENLKAATVAKNIAIEKAYQAMLAERNIYMIAQSRNVAVEIIQQQFRAKATDQVAAANLKLAAAQSAANKSALVNPYFLVTMAVAGLGYAMYKLSTQQTELEKTSKKFAIEVENEKDKVNELFSALKLTTEGTTEHEAAKKKLLDQYGQYIPEQNKELKNLKDIKTAYDEVNRSITENIAIKSKDELKENISNEFNPKITSAKGSILDDLSGQQKSDAQFLLDQFISQSKTQGLTYEQALKQRSEFMSKLGLLDEKGNSNGLNAMGIASNFQAISLALIDMNKEFKSADDSFNKFISGSNKVKSDTVAPDLKTYSEQRKELESQLSIEQKKLEDLKLANFDKLAEAKRKEIKSLEELVNSTGSEAFKNDLSKANAELATIIKQGENPLKAIEGQEAIINGIKKQLGIKEKAAKQEKEDIKSTVEASKEYLAIQQQIIDKQKELTAANKAGNTEKGLQFNEDIVALEKQLKELENGKGITPLKAKLAAAEVDTKTLGTMKQLTEEERKQLELRGKKATEDANTADKLKEQSEYFYQAADAAAHLSQQIGDSNQGLADMLSSISRIAGSMGDLVEKGAFTKDGLKGEDAISAGLSAAVSIMSMIISQGIENKRVQDSWTAAIAESVHQASLLRIESLAYKEANIFGVENPYAKAIAGANQYRASMDELAATSKQLEGGAVQVGTKKVASGSNVAAGVVAGATLGTVIPGVGNVVGAVVGAVVGGIIGLFTKKTIPVFDSLKQKYGEIYDKDTFELNPKIIADYARLDESTKKIVDNWDEIKEKAKEAQEEMQANFKALAGDLGGSLSDSLIEAFRNGKLDSAIDDFHKKVGDVVADILQQMIFAQAFQASFDKLGADMNASFGLNPDGTAMRNSDGSTMTPEQLARLRKANGEKLVDSIIDDDIESFGNGLDERFKFYEKLATATDEQLKKRGFENGLGGSIGANMAEEAARTGSAKGIATASQDSVDENNGRLTAIQGHTFRMADTLDILKANSSSILNNVIEIKGHTESMQGGIQRMEGTLNSVKQGIETINLKGISLK